MHSKEIELSTLFRPMLTPKQMLKKGVFGGEYFYKGAKLKHLPDDWFEGLDKSLYMSDKYQVEINCFKVKSGQSLKEWKKNGWIHADDPKGWFEWYSKYHAGRRHEDDKRQIKRWLSFCGPQGRWRNTIYSKIHFAGCGVEFSGSISVRIQQSLLHWSYIVNSIDYTIWLANKPNKEIDKKNAAGKGRSVSIT